ncbi:MAG: hypothetical protein V1819_01395 [bacterium]
MICASKKFIQIIFAMVFGAVLLLPNISLAGLKLEQNYPAISGITSQSESLNTAVSQTVKNAPTNIVSLIRYLFTLIIIVLIGLATLALIISGVQYLSSAGKVTAQKAARTRLIKAFIGLAIVIGAGLIMQIISPSLNLPQLTPIYNASSNVILISEAGMKELRSNPNEISKEFLNKLAEEGKIKYFASQSSNLKYELGDLKTINKEGYAPYISFDSFDPQYIGFFGPGKNNIQVRAFADKNFLGANYTYSTDGVMNNNDTQGKLTSPTNDNQISSLGGLAITCYVLSPTDYKSKVDDYYDVASQTRKGGIVSPHPPLSMMVQGIGAGVYLYGSDKQISVKNQGTNSQPTMSPSSDPFGGVGSGSGYGSLNPNPGPPGNAPVSDKSVLGKDYIGGKGGQRYLQFDVPNFGDSSFDFDEQANEIEIKNNRDKDKSTQDDLLIFLFQQPYYQGPFRAFFEKRDLAVFDVFDSKSLKDSWYDDDKDAKTSLIKGVYKEKDGSYKTGKAYAVGNVIEEKKTPLNEKSKDPALKGIDAFIDRQGKVVGASSARVFSLAEFNKTSKTYKSSCEAVALCNGPDLQGYCLVFTLDGKSNNNFMSIFLPMPWFLPVSIPGRLNKDMVGAMLVGDDWQKQAFEKNYDVEEYQASQKKDYYGYLEKGSRDFEDNINSIGIKGNCAVALYENSIKTPAKCFTRGTQKDCWDNGTPGEKSMVFSTKDMISGTGVGQMKFLNLKNYQINNCLSHIGSLSLSRRHSCASAVAVYPVE